MITLFYVLTVCFWFAQYAYVPIISTYADALGASASLIGLIGGSYGFTQMLVRIPLGVYSDIIKKRKIFICIGVFLTIVCGFGVFLTQDRYWLLIFRALSGVSASTWVIFTVLFSSYFDPKDAVKSIGNINACNSLGTVAALLAGGFVAQRFGMEYTFLLAGFGGIVAFALSLFVNENKDLEREPIKLADIIETAKDKTLLIVSVLAIISQYISFTTTYGFTPIIARGLGADSFALGLLAAIATFPGMFAAPLAGHVFIKKFGARVTIVAGFVMATFACAVIPFVPNLPVLFLTQVIGGFGRACSFSILMGLGIKNIAGNRRATAMGFFQAIYGLGMFSGPSIAGFIGQGFGYTAAFFATAAIGVVGIVLAVVKVKD